MTDAGSHSAFPFGEGGTALAVTEEDFIKNLTRPLWVVRVADPCKGHPPRRGGHLLYLTRPLWVVRVADPCKGHPPRRGGHLLYLTRPYKGGPPLPTFCGAATQSAPFFGRRGRVIILAIK